MFAVLKDMMAPYWLPIHEHWVLKADTITHSCWHVHLQEGCGDISAESHFIGYTTLKRGSIRMHSKHDYLQNPGWNLPDYLHSVVEECSQLFKTAIFLLFMLQPSLWHLDHCWVDVDKRLSFDKRPQHKSSQPKHGQTFTKKMCLCHLSLINT